jgi:hypothetical protein
VHDFDTLEGAVAYAHCVVPDRLRALARQAGADHVEIRMAREDCVSPVAVEWAREVYLETQLTFTAVGRPGLAR